MHTIVLPRRRIKEEPWIVSWIRFIFPECRVFVADTEDAGPTPIEHTENGDAWGPQKTPTQGPSQEINTPLIKPEHATPRFSRIARSATRFQEKGTKNPGCGLMEIERIPNRNETF